MNPGKSFSLLDMHNNSNIHRTVPESSGWLKGYCLCTCLTLISITCIAYWRRMLVLQPCPLSSAQDNRTGTTDKDHADIFHNKSAVRAAPPKIRYGLMATSFPKIVTYFSIHNNVFFCYKITSVLFPITSFLWTNNSHFFDGNLTQLLRFVLTVAHTR